MQDTKIDIKIKLASLWTSLMFCYVYGDYFGLYQPGHLESMLDGKMGPLGDVTQGVLLGTSALMAIPSLMVCLSILLGARISRWLNIVFGILYTLVIIVTMPGSWNYYIFLGVIEALLSILVVVHAIRWPKAKAA